MNIGAVILCRYDSSRLFGKALREINHKPILEWITLFIKQSPMIDDICVATSIESSDDLIAQFCDTRSIKCFRGSKDDVALRFLQCSQENHYDYAFRVNGDNLFVEPTILTLMVNLVTDEKYDFVSNVARRSFPYGMSAELLNVEFYGRAYRSFYEEKHHEHVTLYLYENSDLGKRMDVDNEEWKHLPGIQLAIDTIEDVRRAEKVFERVNGDYRRINYALLNEMARVGDLS